MIEQQIEDRLQELQAEYQKGQEQLAALEQEANNIRTSLLRIGGAIQVLQEIQEISQTTVSEQGEANVKLKKAQ